MGTMTTLPRGEAFTRHDLESMPDDGRRYELVDGTLVVTPAPSLRHQVVSSSLFELLVRASSEDLKVLHAPTDIVLGDATVLQPDLMVVPRANLTGLMGQLHPLLVIEILSPSTKLIDVTVKRARYQAARCPSYWVVDPDAPSLTVWELEDKEYVERAHVVDDETATLTTPFVVTISPQTLLL